MPYWNFEYTKAVIYTVVKVGGGIGQDSATAKMALLAVSGQKTLAISITNTFLLWSEYSEKSLGNSRT